MAKKRVKKIDKDITDEVFGNPPSKSLKSRGVGTKAEQRAQLAAISASKQVERNKRKKKK